MRAGVPQWFRGSVRIRITGHFCERFLNLCAFHNIPMWSVSAVDEGYELCLPLKKLYQLQPLVRKCHVRVKIIRRFGLPFLAWRYRARKVFFLAVGVAAVTVLVLSFFLWDIHMEGNLTITKDQMDSFLSSRGIQYGIFKASVDCKNLADEIRMYFSEVTWVSVRLQGTRLMIRLQENTDTQQKEEETSPGDLISDVDGTIVKMITRTGMPQVSVGDTVQKGDLLVAGYVDLENDSGEVYERRYVPADADIYVKTEIEYEDAVHAARQVKAYTGRIRRRMLFQFGPLRIGVPFFGFRYEKYDCTYTRKQLRIADHFFLPAYISGIWIREYEVQDQKYTKSQLRKIAEEHLTDFLENFQKKGVQIFENDVKIDTTDSICTAAGKVRMIVKVGKLSG